MVDLAEFCNFFLSLQVSCKTEEDVNLAKFLQDLGRLIPEPDMSSQVLFQYWARLLGHLS